MLRRHVGVGSQPPESVLAVETTATRFIIQRDQGHCIDNLDGPWHVLGHLGIFPWLRSTAPDG